MNSYKVTIQSMKDGDRKTLRQDTYDVVTTVLETAVVMAKREFEEMFPEREYEVVAVKMRGGFVIVDREAL